MTDRVDIEECDRLRVGDGATFVIASDRVAGTVIKRTRTRLHVQDDKVKPTHKGQTEAQSWLSAPDADGHVRVFSRRYRRDGSVTWKRVGHRTRSPGCYLIAGRHHYRDPHF